MKLTIKVDEKDPDVQALQQAVSEAYRAGTESGESNLSKTKDNCDEYRKKLVRLAKPADNQYIREMSDEVQQNDWREFHQKHARLRVVSKVANLSRIKKENR